MYFFICGDYYNHDYFTEKANAISTTLQSRNPENKSKHRKTGSLPDASIAYDNTNLSTTTSTTSSSRPLSQDCSQIAASSSVSSDFTTPRTHFEDENTLYTGEKVTDFIFIIIIIVISDIKTSYLYIYLNLFHKYI